MPQKRKDLNIRGANLWYLVGLITSDGCLSKDGRHIDITSKDYQFLSKLKDHLKLTNKIGIKYGFKKQKSFHIQFANRNFYDFLLSIGLMQHKSLMLSAIKVPDGYFIDFLRGLIDGDGCIRSWLHRTNRREQWSLRIFSGSPLFIKWLASTAEFLLKAKGKIHYNGETLWTLKYGKMAARVIIKQCYYDGCLGLQRKILVAKDCLDSYKGWNKSKTINYSLT